MTDGTNIMCLPCEHILHSQCIPDNKKCPICDSYVKHFVDSNKLIRRLEKHNRPKHKQRCIDMLTVSHSVDWTDIGMEALIETIIGDRLPVLTKIITKMLDFHGFDDTASICKDILKLLNIHVHYSGLDNINIDTAEPRIYIANHQSDLDNVVLFGLLKSGFVASGSIFHRFPFNILEFPIPSLIIQRGSSDNTTEKIKQYIEEHGSIIIYPEGRRTHHKTLARFRTGAFYTGYPIYPIVIKYYTDTETKGKIDIVVLPAEYPPFDNEKIETVRKKMAHEGGFYLSRCSNKDRLDTK